MLARAGVDRADVLVACTGLDEVNIVCCAVARQIASPRTTCFVSREDFLTRILHPRAILPVKLGGRVVPERILRDVQVFMLFYLLTFPSARRSSSSSTRI